ncbi:hypothetical protein [Corynebacterium sp. MNWGS58]|uniref:hypothetical protein n=1 Tax=Corynebacterium sp. 102791.4 TaxID=3104612 RepID=UPI0035114FCF
MRWFRASSALALSSILLISCSTPEQTSTAGTATSDEPLEPIGGTSAGTGTSQEKAGNRNKENSSHEPISDVEFEDWVPEIGPADIFDPDFQVFDICGTIPESLVTEAGLYDSDASVGTFLGSRYTDCYYAIAPASQNIVEQHPLEGSIRISADASTRENFEESGLLTKPIDHARIPDIHFHGVPNSFECTVGIETREGRINIGYDEIRSKSFDTNCEIAYHFFSQLLTK